MNTSLGFAIEAIREDERIKIRASLQARLESGSANGDAEIMRLVDAIEEKAYMRGRKTGRGGWIV